MGFTIISCSGVSSTGKLTTQAGLTLITRCPGKIERCIRADMPLKSFENGVKNADHILVLDGCEDCCGRKKIESLGIIPERHIVASDCGIVKRGMEDPSYEEIETLVSAVRTAID